MVDRLTDGAMGGDSTGGHIGDGISHGDGNDDNYGNSSGKGEKGSSQQPEKTEGGNSIIYMETGVGESSTGSWSPTEVETINKELSAARDLRQTPEQTAANLEAIFSQRKDVVIKRTRDSIELTRNNNGANARLYWVEGVPERHGGAKDQGASSNHGGGGAGDGVTTGYINRDQKRLYVTDGSQSPRQSGGDQPTLVDHTSPASGENEKPPHEAPHVHNRPSPDPLPAGHAPRPEGIVRARPERDVTGRQQAPGLASTPAPAVRSNEEANYFDRGIKVTALGAAGVYFSGAEILALTSAAPIAAGIALTPLAGIGLTMALGASVAVFVAGTVHFTTSAHKSKSEARRTTRAIEDVYGLTRGPVDLATGSVEVITRGPSDKVRDKSDPKNPTKVEILNEIVDARDRQEKTSTVIHDWTPGSKSTKAEQYRHIGDLLVPDAIEGAARAADPDGDSSGE